MTYAPPISLDALLAARDDASREAAWQEFLAEHTGLLLHASRNQGGDHDAVMDRYLYVVQALRETDYARLRQYSSANGGKFTTWLLVVARRLCFDEHRMRYGRAQASSESSLAKHDERRQLVDLIGNEVGLETLEEPSGRNPESIMRKDELRHMLARALDELPTTDRLILRFRFEDELSVPEITRLLGESSPFVLYRRLEKILGRMRGFLEGAGITESQP